jgi:hypothetical protein
MGDLSVDAMPMDDGTFQLQGDQLSMVGPWDVVVVRRLGAPGFLALQRVRRVILVKGK